MTTPGPGASGGYRALEGLIRGAAFEGLSTAQIWNEIKAGGLPTDFQAVNQMRSAAVSLRNAMDSLAAAGSEDVITNDMVGRSYFQGTPASAASTAQYQINIPYTYTDESGNTISDWISTSVRNLPSTVGELMGYASGYLAAYSGVPPDAEIGDGLSIQSYY